MKNLFAYLLLVFGIITSGCENKNIETAEKKDDLPVNFDCINQMADKPLLVDVAKKKMIGEWQLKQIATMLPSKTVPDIKVVFSGSDKVEVYENGKLKYGTDYSLKQENIDKTPMVTLETKEIKLAEGDYKFLFGAIRVCDKELLIDNGMAFDAPAYFFVKK